jgi:hypothetical protein
VPYTENIAVCSEIYTKHIKTLCGQNVEFFSVLLGGAWINHWALEGHVISFILLLIGHVFLLVSLVSRNRQLQECTVLWPNRIKLHIYYQNQLIHYSNHSAHVFVKTFCLFGISKFKIAHTCVFTYIITTNSYTIQITMHNVKTEVYGLDNFKFANAKQAKSLTNTCALWFELCTSWFW